MYAKDDYDLAGFAVGAVERGRQITGSGVKAGDVVLGLGSSGVHSNGYSLVRKVVSVAGLDYSAKAPFDPKKTLGEALLAPTKIYVKSCLAAIRAGGVKALAHITGGGLLENIPRVLPKDLACEIDAASWQQPPVFGWLRKTAGIDAQEMARTFNCGIGMILVTSPDRVDAVRGILQDAASRSRRSALSVRVRGTNPAAASPIPVDGRPIEPWAAESRGADLRPRQQSAGADRSFRPRDHQQPGSHRQGDLQPSRCRWHRAREESRHCDASHRSQNFPRPRRLRCHARPRDPRIRRGAGRSGRLHAPADRGLRLRLAQPHR